MDPLDLSGIRAANDLPVTAMDIPEWGGKIFLRPMSNGQADLFSKVASEGAAGENPGHAMAVTVALMMCKESGKPMFPNVDEGVKLLGEKSSQVVQRIFSKAMEIAGNTEPTAEAGKG